VTVDLAAGSVKTAPRPSAKAPSHAPGSEMVASTPKAPKPAPTGSSTTGTTVSTPAPSPPATPVSTTSPSSGSTTSGPAVTPATGSTPGSSASSASYHLPGIPTAAQILAIVHGAAPYVPPGVDDLIRNTYPFK
jgi:hypothetical protein